MQVQSTCALALLFKPPKTSSNIYIVYVQNQLPKPKKIPFNYVESHVKSTGTVIVNSDNNLKQVEKELKLSLCPS